MAAPTNTLTTFNAKGNREDLEDVISRVAPEKTPFTSMIGAVGAKNTYHEWQTETLATPNANNAQFESDDVTTFGAPNISARVGTYTQIFRKEVVVGNTQEAVVSAGRGSDLDHQIVLKGIELKRDMEARFLGNYASAQEVTGTSQRVTAGALAWLTSNTSRASGGANGGFASGTVAAATNGSSTRTSTELLFKSVQASCFNNGATPNVALMNSTQKQNFSAFTGVAQQRRETGDKLAKIIGGADVYVGDFGEVQLVPHPYCSPRDILLLDPEMWAVVTLRGTTKTELAITGDSQKYMLIAEKGLKCSNEKASGVVADLT